MVNHGRIDTIGKILLNSGYQQCIQTLGLPRADYELVTGQDMWLPTDRARVRRVFDAMIFAVQDVQGVVRQDIPAEYIAIMIGVCVDPVNWQTAASWYHLTAKTVAQIDVDEPEPGVFKPGITGDRVYCLVLEYTSAVFEGRVEGIREKLLNVLLPSPSKTRTQTQSQ